MIVKNKFYWQLLFTICILIVVGISSIYIQNISEDPQVEDGSLDLSNWEFERDGIVELRGQWGFTEGIIEETMNPPFQQLADVPGDMPIAKNKGAGTYHLKVILPSDATQSLAVDVEGVRMSNTILVDGQQIHSEGRPTNKREQYQPRNIPYTAHFMNSGKEFTISFQVANFDYYKTGIHLPIYLGTSDQISKRQTIQIAFEASVAFLVIILAFIFFSVYFSLNKEKVGLILGLYFLIMAIFLATTNQKIILQIFPQSPFLLFVKIRDFMMYISVPLLIYYVTNLFLPSKRKANLFKLLASIYLIYCVVIIIIPYRFIGGAGDSILLPMLYVIYFILPLNVFIKYYRGDTSVLSKRELEYFILFLISEVGTIYSSALYYANVIDHLWLSMISNVLAVIYIVLMFFEKFRKTYFSMEHYAAKLERENRLKDEFLFRTSHELKTPLHGIINLAQLTLDNVQKNDMTVIEKNNLLIKATARRMATIVNDLVDFALIQENKFRIELGETDLLYCVQSVVEVLDFQAREKDIKIHVKISDGARYALVDEARFIQVIYNLVQNSLHHTKNGTITISIRLLQKQIRLTVADTGTGIPASEHATIFEAYEQGSHRLNSGGLGLGLAISKQLVLQMGGKLSLDWSEVGKGSSFSIYVEKAQTHPIESNHEVLNQITETSIGTQPVGTNVTILIVDDEPLNRKILREILKYQNGAILEAENGEQVFQILASNRLPDIILLDVMLEDMTGYEICRKIRENYSLIEIPILFITVNHSIRNISQAFVVGGNDFLTKPFEAEEVRARVNTLLQIKRLSKQATENELAFLQTQIKPHFLFNTLSAIMAFTYEDAEKTRVLLESLSIYLRTVFQTSKQTEWIPLRTEIELTEAFVEIQKARYGERLHVSFDVNRELLDYLTPPLLLQPLVENAIAHGVLKRANGGSVFITIDKKQNGIQVTVKDTGIGISSEKIATIFSEKSAGSGIGLANVQKRIHRLTKQPLIINSIENEGTMISYWIPLVLD